MGGGKGGGTTVEIPAWAESAMQDNLRKAKRFAEVGYLPYYGPDVAAFTPLQEQAMQSSYDAAAAFGLAEPGGDALAGMPEAKDFGGGMMGYSSGDLFDQARAELAGRSPELAAAFDANFKPYNTGQPGAGFPDAYGGDMIVPPPSNLTSGAPSGYGGPGGIPPYGTPEFFEWVRNQSSGQFPV